MLDVDPVTFEVLRHRLWMINDEQGRVAAWTSSSPVVYESKDFNTSLLTPEGESVLIGIYTTRVALCLHTVTAHVRRLFAQPGLSDGDAFVTNDPWFGAAHQNDIVMVAPLFWRDRLLGWSGIAMHEVDVGGPNPGSFTVGAADVLGEAPLIPPVRLVDAGRLRADVEAWVVRNSRTPEQNRLNLRARLAAIERTRQRLGEIAAEYGADTLLAVQRGMLDLVGASFRRRLAALPDGTWSETGYLDHDGNRDEVYRIRLAMTKVGEHVTFDFRGTSPQAPGSVNCTRVGLESGVMSALLPAFCYDVPWAPSGVLPAVTILSDEGTLNNARYPAGVSMATVGASFATAHVASACIAKLYACSGLPDEVQACWGSAWQGATIAGRSGGRPFAAVLLDQSGGAGARPWRDGVDTSGSPGTPATGIANVESNEKRYPILYVYRRQATDTAGAGRRRGGMGTELLVVPHGVDGDLDVTVLCHGASHPEGKGLCGGYPGSAQVRLLVRNAALDEALAAGAMPGGLDEVVARPGAQLVPLAAKARAAMGPRDALLLLRGGGGGLGDPLQRPADRVRRDVSDGVTSAEVARRVYGVVLTADGGLDGPASAAAQAALRRERVGGDIAATHARTNAGGPGPGGGRHDGRGAVAAGGPGDRRESGRGGAPVGLGRPRERGPRANGLAGVLVDVLGVVGLATSPAGLVWRCAACGYELGPAEADPKERTCVRRRPITDLSPWNRFGHVDAMEVREFCCPGCAALVGVEVRERDEAPLWDTRLDPQWLRGLASAGPGRGPAGPVEAG